MTKKLTIILITILLMSAICYSERTGSASYYGLGDGFKINLNVYGCATRYYPKGTLLKVSQRNKFYTWSSRHKRKIKCDITKSIVVIVNDYGGNNLLDLNATVFKFFAPYSRGIIHNLKVKPIGYISGKVKIKNKWAPKYSVYNPKHDYPIEIYDNINKIKILKHNKNNIKLKAKKNTINISKCKK